MKLQFLSRTFRSQSFRHQSSRNPQCVFWCECLSSSPLALVSPSFSSGKKRKTELSFRRLVHTLLNKIDLITLYEADESVITMNLSDKGWRDCLSAFRLTASPICTNPTLSALCFSWQLSGILSIIYGVWIQIRIKFVSDINHTLDLSKLRDLSVTYMIQGSHFHC